MDDTGTQQEEPSQKVKTVLIVEDDTAIGKLLVEAFQKITPCHVLLVTDAIQAMEAVKTLVPDLFILDYALPGINGLELYDRLHAQEECKRIPALLTSANVSEDEIKKRPSLAFLAKPFELDELLQKIDAFLS